MITCQVYSTSSQCAKPKRKKGNLFLSSNVKGNKYRLVVTVNYESQTIIVKDLITHAEYSKRGWNK
jgi:mRNA interferase HigB